MEEFKEWVEKEALEYAKDMVMDPEEHMDAVEAIAADFTEGAWAVYNKYVSNEVD